MLTTSALAGILRRAVGDELDAEQISTSAHRAARLKFAGGRT